MNYSRATWLRLGLFFLLLGLAAVTLWLLSDRLSLEYLAQRESQLRQFQRDQPAVAALVGVALYVVVAGCSLPGAALLTLVYGWIFGFWQGLLIASLGSTAGATVAFLVSRYLLRDWLQRWLHDRLAGFNKAMEREGAFYLFTLRLVPAVPFFAVNTVMGLTEIPVTTFWWVSQLGMLPGTAAYVAAGSTVPDLSTLADSGIGTVISWQLLAAFAILGVLPLAIKRLVAWYAPRAGSSDRVETLDRRIDR